MISIFHTKRTIIQSCLPNCRVCDGGSREEGVEAGDEEGEARVK
jgi:hypothetical protein